MTNNDTTKPITFKPSSLCPFCKGNGYLTGRRYFKIICKQCGAETGSYSLPSEAIAAWEKRA